MISIIICSVNSSLLKDLKINIQNTIGIEYEIIAIDNSQNNNSIAKVYNIGFDKAKYEFLLYLHEDIFFHSNDRGQCIVDIFSESKDIGLIGVAGAKFKSRSPSLWTNVAINSWAMHLKQRLPDGTVHFNSSDWCNEKKYIDVKVIDGVFMSTRKSLNIRFDEHIPGFHFYDTYLSLKVSLYGFRSVVSNQFLIEHFSCGNQSIECIKAANYFHSKYNRFMPLGSLIKDQAVIEYDNLQRFIELCIPNNLNYLAITYWIKLFYQKPLMKKNILLLKRILISIF